MDSEGNPRVKMDRRSRTVGRQWICCGGFTSRSGAWAADTAGKDLTNRPDAERNQASPGVDAVVEDESAAAGVWADGASAAAGLRSPVAHGQMALRTKSEPALQGLPQCSGSYRAACSIHHAMFAISGSLNLELVDGKIVLNRSHAAHGTSLAGAAGPPLTTRSTSSNVLTRFPILAMPRM